MGAGAKVHKFALAVEADHSVLRQVLDQLHLVGLALFLHILDRLLPGQLKPLQRQLFLADLAHFLLDFLHDFRSEGEGGIQVIVEAVFNGRANGQLDLREQPLDSLGQHMGGGMAQGPAAHFVLKGQQVQGAVPVDGGHGVLSFAVDLAGQHIAGQALGNLLGHIQRRAALLHFHHGAVFQSDFYHR